MASIDMNYMQYINKRQSKTKKNNPNMTKFL